MVVTTKIHISILTDNMIVLERGASTTQLGPLNGGFINALRSLAVVRDVATAVLP